METINVKIYWEDKNYCCGWSYSDFGAVLCTSSSLESLKEDFKTSLSEQIESMKADGEELPEWLANGDYNVEFSLEISAILRYAESFTTMAALSRVTGINQKQLNNYASSVRSPRPEQRTRILDGLRAISRQLLAVL
ncbi:MAG: CopG family transcriptional regulator [Muribaculaceae bacterium]|nr:CopG family transcriptional regulator [Muribaculaceae bacterium]MDE7155355.1 CopG family transcriptional regulator [Muribaculaceae bacterium]MDE7368902.1 CopG family transcriptional regulator [Muribaculaceae bacterium]